MPKFSKSFNRRFFKGMNRMFPGYSSGKSFKKNKTVKKMTGGTPETAVERIARYGGNLGKVAKTVAQIMTFINTETKWYENTQTYANVTNSASGYILFLNNIAQGAGENDRNGEKIICKNLTLNYAAKVNASATASIIRFIVIYDKKPEVGAATYTDVMNNVSPLAQVNKDNGDRFIILASRQISLSPLDGPVQSGKVYVDLRKIHCDWNSSTANDWEKGAIKLIAVSDEGTNYPTMEIRSRLNFYDN